MPRPLLPSVSVLLVAAWCSAQSPVLELGSRRELFVDRAVVQTLKGAELRLHEPRPDAYVLEFDRPWEGRYCGYVTVFKDRDRFRMYYRGLPEAGADGSAAEVTCYAESADGLTWTKPELGLFEWEGSTANNIVLAGMPPYSHNFAPFLDTKPGVPEAERYKAIAGTSATGLHGFVSPDGIRWTKLDPPLFQHEGPGFSFDSQNVGFWSESEQLYLCYYRTWHQGFRTISRRTSPDFQTWGPQERMTFGDTPMEHLYTNQTLPYFRAPHIYLAIAARFMPGRRVVSEIDAEAIGGEAAYSGDCSDTVFFTSRGGSTYDRSFMEGFVRPGIGLNNWTSRTNYPARGVIPAGPDAMAIFVQRNYGQTTHRLQRLLLRTDGFVSLHAPYAGGQCITRPLRFEGTSLELNVSTSAAGSVWVEIQDENGNRIAGHALDDCDEIVGDSVTRTITWNGNADLSALVGKVVRLRFVLKDADVFAFRFAPEAGDF